QALADQFIVFATVRGRFEDVERYRLFDRSRTVEMVDATSASDLEYAIIQVEPDVVINCAGVVKQVPASQNVIATLNVNSILPHRLEELSSRFGFRLILISTDCVFRGDQGNYSEADVPDATDLYGRSKVLGEVDAGNVLTIRTSLIGRELASSHGLIEWFLRNRGKTVDGYRRAIFSGFPTVVFADIIGDLLLSWPDLHGIYHISSDPIDKYRLLCLVGEVYDAGIAIHADDSVAIDRSLNSTRFRKVTGFTPPPWKEMVERMAADPTPYDEWRK
ncbi:MAG TPA: SDR family oxidoreductase, partial [Pyrinomonadaceae bacterium]